jgi:hypothetical protein
MDNWQHAGTNRSRNGYAKLAAGAGKAAARKVIRDVRALVEVGAEARSAAPEVAVQKALEALGDATVAPLGHIGIADQQFATAFNHVRVATERCLELALALGKEPLSEDRRQALDLAIDEMNNAIGQLTNAAERYLRDAR